MKHLSSHVVLESILNEQFQHTRTCKKQSTFRRLRQLHTFLASSFPRPLDASHLTKCLFRRMKYSTHLLPAQVAHLYGQLVPESLLCIPLIISAQAHSNTYFIHELHDLLTFLVSLFSRVSDSCQLTYSLIRNLRIPSSGGLHITHFLKPKW